MKYNRLTLKWLDYNMYKPQIQILRKTVFMEEQGLEDFVLDSPIDEKGLHLGLFSGDNLVSSVSLFPFRSDDHFVRELGIESSRPYVIQFSRRVELPEFRNQGYSSLILAHVMRSSYELFQPDCIFAILLGPHIQLIDHYMNSYRFNRYEKYESEHGEGYLLTMDDQATIDQVASQLHFQSIKLSESLNIELPDLTVHISENKNLEEYLKLKGDQTNRYLSPLSLQDELPRLSSQSRLLFNSQINIWKNLLSRHPEYNTILDMGCGPGVYLSLLKKLDEVRNRKLMGMDISKDFITYARFSHPTLDWIVGSVYDTNLESGSVDIIHCSFLFIHLINPFLALKEIHRILSPNGILYISDVNDSTFTGPEKIKNLIEAHNEIYEGNRSVMSTIVPLAQKAGFDLQEHDNLVVDNTGIEHQVILEERRFKLGKLAMWGMFSFLGQRDEVKDLFEVAEQCYFNSDSKISIEIQTRIFKKI